MKLSGINFFSPTPSSPMRRQAQTQQTVQAQDRLELSSSPIGGAEVNSKPKFSLKSLNLPRLTTVGLAALCFFGSMVAELSGEQLPAKTFNAPAVQEQVLKSPEIGVEGWIIGVQNVANPASLPDKPPAPEPFKLSKPTPAKHDYIKHHVNFSQLMSNQEFSDTSALDAKGIQTFLEDRNSFLADFNENGLSAAQIIYNASHDAGLNPYVVLTTLEKENSMISRQKCPKKGALAASMGYGYTDGGTYTAGARSFTGQVNKGAQLLAKLYADGQTKTFPLTYKADYGKHKVQIDNAATWALFEYTPHTVDTGLKVVGGGNYRFREVLQDFTNP